MRPRWQTGLLLGVLTLTVVIWTSRRVWNAETEDAASARVADAGRLANDDRAIAQEQRDAALARAQVWTAPVVPVAAAYFGVDPIHPRELTCRFQVSALGGTTPKFDCRLDSGETIRVKYGGGGEIPAEAATTALLRALGFGADDVRLVNHLRCQGCPDEPFLTMKAVELTRTASLYEQQIAFDSYTDHEWVAVERKLPAPAIETEDLEGWAFFELEKVDPSLGGAPRAHVDALRLLAVFLAHWDNKPENQRMVCLSPDWPEGSACSRPFLLMQDVGATFGPRKLDLEGWEAAEIWQDRATCTLTMHGLPHGGATFQEARIGESGRQFLGRLLSQLSERQLTDLFATARFDHHQGLLNRSRPLADWVRAFKRKVAAITDGPACPSP